MQVRYVKKIIGDYRYKLGYTKQIKSGGVTNYDDLCFLCVHNCISI